MKIITLKEEPAFYEDLRKLMNLSLKNDFIDENLFEEVILNDPNFDESMVLIGVKGDIPIAYIFGVRRLKEPKKMVESHKDIIWIKSLGIIKGEDINYLKELLNIFENIAIDNKCKYIRVSDFASWFITAGIDINYEAYNNLLISNRFNIENKAIDYELDLSEFHIPKYVNDLYKKLNGEGIRIHAKKENEEVFKWIEKEFPFGVFWSIEAKNTLKRKDGGILVAYKNDEIIGFSVYGAFYPSRFGPIGVDSRMRGKGIGTILLYEAIKNIRLNGQRIAMIPWVEKEASFFYMQLPGIKRVRYFNIYSKRILD